MSQSRNQQHQGRRRNRRGGSNAFRRMRQRITELQAETICLESVIGERDTAIRFQNAQTANLMSMYEGSSQQNTALFESAQRDRAALIEMARINGNLVQNVVAAHESVAKLTTQTLETIRAISTAHDRTNQRMVELIQSSTEAIEGVVSMIGELAEMIKTGTFKDTSTDPAGGLGAVRVPEAAPPA